LERTLAMMLDIEFARWTISASGTLSFSQRLKFPAGDGERWLHIEQRFEAFQANENSGFLFWNNWTGN
jgi:hypothetical protein